MKIAPAIAVAALAALPVFADTLSAQRISVDAGQTRSIRLTSKIPSSYFVGSGRGIARLSFDQKTNRLIVRGLTRGIVRVTFGGIRIRVVSGCLGPTRQRVRFRHKLKIIVRRPREAEPRTKPRSKPPRQTKPPLKEQQRDRGKKRAPKIHRQTTWRIRRGRSKSVELASVLHGRIVGDYGVNVIHKSVARTFVEKGRLHVRGLRRGGTTVFLRGSVVQRGKRVPYVIQIHVVVIEAAR